MGQLLNPKIKPTLQLIVRSNGFIFVGTVTEGFELDRDPYLPLLRRCTGEFTTSQIAAQLGESLTVVAAQLEKLQTLGIIEEHQPLPAHSESLLSHKRREIETILTSHRSSDGSAAEWRARRDFSILITGDTRIARNLLPLLAASGFINTTLMVDSVTSAHLEFKDINALTVTIGDLGKSKRAHHQQLMQRAQIVSSAQSLSDFRFHPAHPSRPAHPSHGTKPHLAIATCEPRADEIQRWQSEGISHLAVGPLVGSQIEISPIITPGVTPCLQCIALHKRDALPHDLHPLSFNLAAAGAPSSELPVASAALVASLLTSLAIDSSWRAIKRELKVGADQAHLSHVINLLSPTSAPVERRWSFHPECGCVDVRRRAWLR